jgi:hypothetical protein
MILFLVVLLFFGYQYIAKVVGNSTHVITFFLSPNLTIIFQLTIIGVFPSSIVLIYIILL